MVNHAKFKWTECYTIQRTKMLATSFVDVYKGFLI